MRIKSTFIALSAATTVSLVAVMSNVNTLSASFGACECEQNVAFNASLPLSHPANRCSMQDEVNWYSWVRGGSGSFQFHFIDFVELLTPKTKRNSPTGPLDRSNDGNEDDKRA